MSEISVRYHYLDNLRWGAMLVGVFIHTSTIGNFGTIENLGIFSDMFRMSLFFMISGYLAGLLLSKQSILKFLKSRFRNLFVPLAFGLIVLNPLTLYLVYTYLNGQPSSLTSLWQAIIGNTQDVKGQLVWHLHLWFLISLIFYALAAPVLLAWAKAIARTFRTFHNRTKLHGQICGVTFITLSVLLILIGLEAVESITGPLPWLLRVTALYTPYYFIGLVLYCDDTVLKWVTTPSYILGIILIFLHFSLPLIDLSESASAAAESITLSLIRAWICFLLINWGNRFINHRNPTTDLASRSIYTVYLLHYMLIYVLAFMYRDIFPADSLRLYFAVSLSTILVGLIFHHYVVSRNSWIAYLMNGQITKAAS